MDKFNFKKIIPYVSAIIIFIVITMVYLSPLFEGQRLKQDDITRHKGMSKEIVDYREKTGIDPLWTNSMFGGMPAYQISVKYKGNLVRFIDDILRVGIASSGGIGFSIHAWLFHPVDCIKNRSLAEHWRCHRIRIFVLFLYHP